jgi:hypothetical protein
MVPERITALWRKPIHGRFFLCELEYANDASHGTISALRRMVWPNARAIRQVARTWSTAAKPLGRTVCVRTFLSTERLSYCLPLRRAEGRHLCDPRGDSVRSH